MAAPAGAAASPSPQPSPFMELVKGPSGLEKVVLRGARNCSAEVTDSDFPTIHGLLTVFVVCACGCEARGVAIRLDLGAVCADPVGIRLIRVGFGRN